MREARGTGLRHCERIVAGCGGRSATPIYNAAGRNRLLGFEQTATAGGNSATTSVSYQYNAAGDLLGDGLRSYAYDSQGRMESATTGEGMDAWLNWLASA